MRAFVLWASSMGILVSVLCPAPALAAMRECKRTVWSATFSGDDEQVAMKMALDDWIRKAAEYGERFTRWQLSEAHQIKCMPTVQAKFECVACGAPCAIVQAPPSSWRGGPHVIIKPCAY